jgi:hypothetical protein
MLCAAFAEKADVLQGRLTGVDGQHLMIPAGPLRRMTVALQRLGPLLVHPDLPEPRPADVQQWVRDPSVSAAQLDRVVGGLVWEGQQQQPWARALGPGRLLSVKAGTALQLGPVKQLRQVQHQQYAAQALRVSGLDPPAKEQATQAFVSRLGSLWRVPWENRHKEVLWRLMVNGVPGAGGHDICLEGSCPCGFTLSAAQVRAGDGSVHRQHSFWDCPVAEAVKAQLQRVLGQQQLQQHHLWLVQPPSLQLQPAVWQIVALAALTAMDRGRRYMWWLFKCQQQQLERQQQRQRMTAAAVAAAVTAAAAEALQAAQTRAAALFWLALEEFCGSSRRPPGTDWDRVGPAHPFLAVHVQVPLQPRLVVVLPP